ncbi:M64 family metallopeptidase [Dyadobacter jiangsuensis]|uniref:Putative secreted protein (Por secretion system target) n=1 Tax=Dyadobacter jiangsuensis TaxID=1591085 RepID=A0A2P8FRF9_9BACT|nr:M64 family metallopeptidase [Dyadobacter jiangsuensis]PSL24312.1 putative secreted protein (Por secretion system target) [Dyadobacter jiangsuensis]
MKSIFSTLYAICIAAVCFGQEYQVDTLYKTGPMDNRINVVILGDGFTQEELPKFATEAKNFADFFLGYNPYLHYRNYFNFFAIRTPSAESGVTNPGTAPDAYKDQPVGVKNTFFGSTFGSSIHRLVTISKYDVLYALLAKQLPMYDLVIVLVNTPFYGGSGGSISVHTLHTQANTIGVHEIGHTFSHLNDEYWAGPGYGWEAPNMTKESSPALVKWKNWLSQTGIGIYKHGETGDAALWHKPANGTCLMEYLNQEFCAVCREATVETLLKQVNPIENVEPAAGSVVTVNDAQTFKVGLLAPSPNTLQVQWTVNGELLSTTGAELTLMPEQAPDGAILAASVFDTTDVSRYDGARADRTRTLEWTLKSGTPNVFRVTASKDTICVGQEVTLTAYGCRGTLSWTGGAAGASLKVKPEQTTTYSVFCKVEGAPTQTIEVPVQVMPLPNATAVNGGPYLVGGTIELTATGGISYLWSGPRSFASTLPHVLLHDAVLESAGTYEVGVTDANGCSKSAQTEVKIDPVLSVPTGPEAFVTISPNPAREFLSVETRLGGRSSIKLYDQAGREVFSKSFEKKTDIKLNVATGLYLYRFTNGGRVVSGKVAVQ